MYQQNIRSTRSREPVVGNLLSAVSVPIRPHRESQSSTVFTVLLLPDLMPPNLSRAEQSRAEGSQDRLFFELTVTNHQKKKKKTDSRVADVDPRADLVEVFGGPAVEAAVVRQQVVELLQRHLEARHGVRPVRHLLAPLALHPVSGGLGLG